MNDRYAHMGRVISEVMQMPKPERDPIQCECGADMTVYDTLRECGSIRRVMWECPMCGYTSETSEEIK